MGFTYRLFCAVHGAGIHFILFSFYTVLITVISLHQIIHSVIHVVNYTLKKKYYGQVAHSVYYVFKAGSHRTRFIALLFTDHFYHCRTLIKKQS